MLTTMRRRRRRSRPRREQYEDYESEDNEEEEDQEDNESEYDEDGDDDDNLYEDVTAEMKIWMKMGCERFFILISITTVPSAISGFELNMIHLKRAACGGFGILTPGNLPKLQKVVPPQPVPPTSNPGFMRNSTAAAPAPARAIYSSTPSSASSRSPASSCENLYAIGGRRPSTSYRVRWRNSADSSPPGPAAVASAKSQDSFQSELAARLAAERWNSTIIISIESLICRGDRRSRRNAMPVRDSAIGRLNCRALKSFGPRNGTATSSLRIYGVSMAGQIVFLHEIQVTQKSNIFSLYEQLGEQTSNRSLYKINS
jgi:hypothetical protein